MLRTRRLTPDDVFQPLGDLVLGLVGVVVIIAILAVAAVALALDWMQRQKLLGPIAFAVMVFAVLVHFTGCATPPAHDPRDPEVWRPTAPARYPLPR
jgi:apolipoprotein N-acyltransferase